jgi:hypothetical protein
MPTETENKKPEHEYTVELIYHFTCKYCMEWWSYAHQPSQLEDFNLNLPSQEPFWCPHCGTQANLKVKEGFPV